MGFWEKKKVKFFLLIFFSKFFFFNWPLYPNLATFRNFNRPILVGRALGNSDNKFGGVRPNRAGWGEG